MKRLTSQGFIERCISKHGEKYDYSATEYLGMQKDIKYWCKTCEKDVIQKAQGHSSGLGCKDCGLRDRIASNKSRTMTHEQYMVKVRAKHGNTYDYTKTKYTGINNKITYDCISCDTEVVQRASSHIEGFGCKYCAEIESVKRCEATRSDTEAFIKKAKILHGDKYDYSAVEYTIAHEKINIKCRKHDMWFMQLACNHLQKNGCPECSLKLRGNGLISDPEIDGVLYLVRMTSEYERFYKIGITSQLINKRLSQQKWESGKEYTSTIISTYCGKMVRLHDIESQIKQDWDHRQYIPLKKFGGYTECFQLNGEMIAEIDNQITTLLPSTI